MSDPENQASRDQNATQRENVAPPQHQEGESGSSRSKNQKSGDGWSKWVAIGSLTFDGIIAISAIVGGCFVAEQLKVMEDSNKDARKANREILTEMRRTNDLTSEALVQGEEQFGMALEQGERHFKTGFEQGRTDAAIEQGLTRKSLAESRRALEFTQRARIGLDTFPEFPVKAVNEIQTVTAMIKNSGAVPAIDVRHRLQCELRSTPFPDDFPVDFSVRPLSRGVLPAGASNEMEVELPGFTEAEVTAIVSGARSLYCVGTIRYLDGFNVERTARFCGFRRGRSNKWRICGNNNWNE